LCADNCIGANAVIKSIALNLIERVDYMLFNNFIYKKFKGELKETLDLLRFFSGNIIPLFSGLSMDDINYKTHFEHNLSNKIYRLHLSEYFVCCAFCNHLSKAPCHEYCFSCGRQTYIECSPLLPGIFSFLDTYFYTLEKGCIPWIFKTPCTFFESLDIRNYFRNFVSVSTSVTIANYETLEGLFLGVSREKKPCHICASVNIEIYKACARDGKNAGNTPCGEIINKIADKYNAIPGMIIYA